MQPLVPSHDAIVIGGGFYGVVIAVYLARQRGLRRVALVERESALLRRASYNNQARVHNGYHYPRSFTTAYRSRVNLPAFVRDWGDAVVQDFTKVYAIARRNSKVTARQFERFCQNIGAPTQPAGPALRALFEPRLIEDVFEVQEYAFDAARLAQWAERELRDSGVQVLLGTTVTAVSRGAPGQRLQVTACASDGPDGAAEAAVQLGCQYLFNCSYSGLNHLGGDFPGTQTPLKHEITEMALVDPPAALKGLGVTVMDGPFFSLMPFPARGLHTLSHVRYTPHLHWSDQPGLDPHHRLAAYERASRFDRMLRDVGRYMPAMMSARHMESLFEVKTTLAKNEGDDGRPILFEKHGALPGCYSILGGKIDNIYDAIDKLEREALADA
ncbi:MAG: FAD-dependent oxidoreductase [Pseudomonadota bacterium]